MSSGREKSLAAMRTFARDVERERGAHEPPLPDTNNQQPEDGTAHNNNSSTPEKHSEKKPEPPAPREKETEQKHIPAFHEMKHVVKTDIKAESPKAKKKEKKKSKKGIAPTKPVGGGTVITDNKKPKRSFFADLQKSLTDWFSDVKKILKPKKNVYVVEKTDRRKGVVQKATSKTGTIFAADSESMREQIKARQRAEKHNHEEDLNWSPYTEPGYPLLEGETESVDPRIEKVSITPKTDAVPKPVIKQSEKIPELQEKQEIVIDESLLETEETKSPTPVETPAEVPAEEPIEMPQSEVPLEEEEITDEGEENGNWKLEDVSLKDTNTLAMLLVGIVLAIGLVVYILFNIFGLGGTSQDNESNEPARLFTGANFKEIVLSEQSLQEMVTKTNAALIENQNTNTEYRYVNPGGEELSIAMIMDLIRTESDDGFTDVVTAVRFVETDREMRALILSTPTESATLGSMLNWESTLLSDLGSLLDIQNVPPSAGEFIDTTIGELDVRLLTFDDETLLVYSLIHNSDVIIAEDESVILNLIEQ